MMDALGKAGLTSLDALGQTFDPHVHQAVEMVESAEHRDQEIVEQVLPGYRLKKRLLRPAVVKVAVAKAAPGEKAE
jgi:molecular chaperone GrpE